MTPPRYIGITMGCPVGIGPEIILKFFLSSPQNDTCRPVVLGDIGVLRRAAVHLSLECNIVPWRPGEDFPPSDSLPVMEISTLDPAGLAWGEPTAETGRAMGRYIEEAVRLSALGVIEAIVTCPVSKYALRMGGYPFPGHTEMLARLTSSDQHVMMMAGPVLRVSLVTIHVPLSAVPGLLTPREVLRVIGITGRSLAVDYGIAAPRLAVAGLNPHAGEGGLFGDEEERIIVPAVAAARQEGWQVTGPLPPDTVFHRAVNGEFDAVVCMYHDQGLIPFKLLHFSNGVNVTLGLPLVRTSVDHGTAYDIAGQGLASPESLHAAWNMAAGIAGNRSRARTQHREDIHGE